MPTPLFRLDLTRHLDPDSWASRRLTAWPLAANAMSSDASCSVVTVTRA